MCCKFRINYKRDQIMEKSLATVCILDILKQDSDENHLLRQCDIIDKLSNLYGIVLTEKPLRGTC